MKSPAALILVFVVVALCAWSRPAFPQVLEVDSLALVALYDSTDGPDWVDAATWLNGPVSTWEGVTVIGNRVFLQFHS